MQPFGSLAGQRAVVTGSSSGIGRAIALEFARAGADVVVHANHSQDRAEQVAAEIRSLGQQAWVILADLSLVESLNKFQQAVWQQIPKLDIWVNNAGADLLTGPAADWDYATKLQRLLD